MGNALTLVFGGTVICRHVLDAEDCLRDFLDGNKRQRHSGLVYYNHQPVTPCDQIFPEDLGITLALNSRATGRAVSSVSEKGQGLNLRALPSKPLEDTSESERENLAQVLTDVSSWPGFKASLATKMLHKKRPALIPVLDNLAIFGAYMNPDWPEARPSGESIGDKPRIEQALNMIAADLVMPENLGTWRALQEISPERKRIEIFDMVWWVHFERVESERRRA